mmetsp:Transcript_9750/g.32370  ORF Transcript_9750/g.32370 Transcript_9750/m.32370 type:complete len:382 (+) Transcript_9750:192-1337(+)
MVAPGLHPAHMHKPLGGDPGGSPALWTLVPPHASSAHPGHAGEAARCADKGDREARRPQRGPRHARRAPLGSAQRRRGGGRVDDKGGAVPPAAEGVHRAGGGGGSREGDAGGGRRAHRARQERLARLVRVLDRQCEEVAALLEPAQRGGVLRDHRGVGVDQNDGGRLREDVNRASELIAHADKRLERDERAEAARELVARRARHLALLRAHHEELLRGRLPRPGARRQRGEALRLNKSVEERIHLRVAARESTRHRQPVAVATVRPAVHLDEARSVLGQDDLAVRRAVPDLQRVQHGQHVSDQPLRHRLARRHRKHPKVDKGRAVARPLVVLPHRRHLVLARRGDGVDDVLGADEELLAQHGAALRADAALRAHEGLEVRL